MKRKKSKINSLESQVAKVIDFMTSHEWGGPLALPLNLHKDLEKFTERYLFDSFIDLNYAYQNFKKEDFIEAGKRLEYSLIWKEEAAECSNIAGFNNFTTLLFNKTEELFTNTINEICSNKTFLEQIHYVESENIKKYLSMQNQQLTNG